MRSCGSSPPRCKRRGTDRFLPAGPPPAVLERSCADVSVLAMAKFWEWHAAEAAVERLPKDPFLKALNCAGSRRAQLEIFLSDPDVPIDTNHLERGVRPIACGRKNWLFAWTGDGAARTASIQSLLFTCAPCTASTRMCGSSMSCSACPPIP